MLEGSVDANRIYFDTNFFIYLVEGIEPYRQRVTRVSNLVAQQAITGITSDITLAEALVVPHRTGNVDLALAYKRLFLESEIFELVSVSRSAWESAAAIRANTGGSLSDALHLAVALETRCRFFLTNDRTIKSIRGLEVLYLGDEGVESRMNHTAQEPSVMPAAFSTLSREDRIDWLREELKNIGISGSA